MHEHGEGSILQGRRAKDSNQWEVRIKSHKTNVCEEMNKCRVDVVIIVWQSKSLKIFQPGITVVMYGIS